MDILILLARMLLAAVFAVAGLAKLADLPGSRRAAAAFGVPERIAPAFAILLPLAELLAAVALLSGAWAWWGAVGSLALLGIFVVAIGANLARGRQPDCHCFGQLHSAPAGWGTLVRNVVLAAVAALVVSRGSEGVGPGPLAWLLALPQTDRLIVLVGGAGLLLLAAEALFLWQLLAQNGRLMVRLDGLEERLDGLQAVPGASGSGHGTTAPGAGHHTHGLPVGRPAPGLSLASVDGPIVTLDQLREPGRPVLLMFMDPSCGSCNELIPDVARWQREHAETLTIAVISRGGADVNRPKVEKYGLANLLLQQNREANEAFEFRGTPGAVLVEADGTIGSPTALGADAIRALLAQSVVRQAWGVAAAPPNGHAHSTNGAVADPHAGHHHDRPAAAVNVGDPSPPIRLPDLEGTVVDLAAYRGRQTLLLFWHPECHPCDEMLPDLRRWETEAAEDAPRLVLISIGKPEEHAGLGLRAPVLLEPRFETGRGFGVNGTPMAVLLDEEGRVASDIAAGPAAVLGLANGRLPDPAERPPAPTSAAHVGVGDQAPSFELPGLDGELVSLSDYRGAPTLVLFWSPSCGFCQRMLGDLKRWEDDAATGAPRLLVVSRGSREANGEQGLRSTIVLDQTFQVGASFGARGTPSAALVDADGRLAAPLAVGADAVLDLARAMGSPAP